MCNISGLIFSVLLGILFGFIMLFLLKHAVTQGKKARIKELEEYLGEIHSLRQENEISFKNGMILRRSDQAKYHAVSAVDQILAMYSQIKKLHAEGVICAVPQDENSSADEVAMAFAHASLFAESSQEDLQKFLAV